MTHHSHYRSYIAIFPYYILYFNFTLRKKIKDEIHGSLERLRRKGSSLKPLAYMPNWQQSDWRKFAKPLAR